MKALLLIAHGSRKQSSNEEVAQLAQKIAKLDHSFELVNHGFLELTTPNANDALAKLVEQGATHMTVLPYFLAAGHHVISDFPEIMDKAQQDHPNVEFKLLPHLGAMDGMAQWIIELSE
jgi:sirohydrochlorin ferrochelatase